MRSTEVVSFGPVARTSVTEIALKCQATES